MPEDLRSIANHVNMCVISTTWPREQYYALYKCIKCYSFTFYELICYLVCRGAMPVVEAAGTPHSREFSMATPCNASEALPESGNRNEAAQDACRLG